MLFGKRTKKRTEAELRQKFTKLGVSDIDFQVKDELDEGSSPRLAPLVMFHNIWKGVLRKGDTQWINETIRQFEARKNLKGAAAAMWPQEDDFLTALLAVQSSGIDLNHITVIARRCQEHLLHHIAYKLSDSHSDEEEFKDVSWAVYETDEAGKPQRQMNVLHEYASVVEPGANEG